VDAHSAAMAAQLRAGAMRVVGLNEKAEVLFRELVRTDRSVRSDRGASGRNHVVVGEVLGTATQGSLAVKS
jgi:hypothetical protein